MKDINTESNVNFYAKAFPTTFQYAKGDTIINNKGEEYIDFFCGAGVLNYGHNNDRIKREVLSFLQSDNIIHCLDMDSEMKHAFLKNFENIVLTPRALNYKIQFPGPTGTNAVEAAIKLARKITKRKGIVSFSNSFHGMTSMSFALSASREHLQYYNSLHDISFFPYENFDNESVDALNYLKKMIGYSGTGVSKPAAIILESIQCEGGINVGSLNWLKELRAFTKEEGILLIIDDIQVGCGRTGDFFSFERAGIYPDLVLLSKSISGLGLPLSMVLIKPELDAWNSGEHNGTFRSNNLSLCAANAALDFWKDSSFSDQIKIKGQIVEKQLQEFSNNSDIIRDVRGLGMVWGLECKNEIIANKIASECFENKLLIETCGNKDQVLKILPPLTISIENLERGLSILKNSIALVSKITSKEVQVFNN